MEVSQFAPGNFCWVELSTTDSAAAKTFYGGLFGWGTLDHDMGEQGVYTMFQKGGKAVGAMYQDASGHMPPHWSSYISVASADDAAAKARSLGGNVMMEPFDVMEVGRMAVIQDPTGAAFCVWQAKQHKGADIVDEPNAFCWDELNTHDCAAARQFYTSLFGWTAKGENAEYVEFHLGDRAIGGMMAIKPEWGEVPPNWLPYFQVTDCDGVASKAGATGGKALVPPSDIPHVGRFSVIQDPQGAVFAIVQLK